ncbi:T9SS type A sorting domain-containing protein [Reichenbachiella versicolor]|uniref:T9SS type A sorting domain-containing protein n=1 Tax=Reichenbachiella versicolor TaxID=1821036 RepID=UPI000D6DE3BC|nr:T9SS type A sorting domain-containing protein [Reichenbachiella versicolor]
MKQFLLTVLSLILVIPIRAQVKVNVNLNVKHKLGDVETFDRQKFVNFHSTVDQKNWQTDNKIDDLIGDFLGKRDVHIGRNTGTIKYALNSVVTEDPTRPGFADPASIASYGKTVRKGYDSKEWAQQYEYLDDQILCNQIHPFYPDGKKTNKGWAFSQTDTEEEPLGTASGEFLGRFIQEYYGTTDEGSPEEIKGKPFPNFVEIVNEPLWDLVTVPTSKGETPHSLTKAFEFHSNVAKEVRKYNADVQIGGYCAAFPDFDKDNFQRWHDRDKHFMDVAGADMDFFTIHLYDFPTFNKKAKYRKGSNMEATLDMMEQYSWMKFDKVKPIMISEYNAQTHDYNKQGWSGYRDWLKMKSTISMMMQFMEHANNINYAMPFFMLKAEWQYNADAGPTSVHGARMLRRENEPTSYSGDFVYTEVIKLYDLLMDINGTRVDSYSNNQDIMVDTYVEGDKAYVMINNLDFVKHEIDLSLSGIDISATDIEVRHLHLNGTSDRSMPVLDIDKYSELPTDLTIDPESTYVIVLTYPSDITIDEQLDETKYYAETYLQTIEANSTIAFDVNDVSLSDHGEAVLRLGVGRDHGLSLSPTIKVNDTEITLPSNFRGGDQADRDNFFGVLEIPFSYDLLKKDNKVEVTFSDNGGHVSTAILQVSNFSTDLGNRDVATDVSSLEFEPSDIVIYPNPTKNHFIVEVKNSSQPFQVKVYSMGGKLMHHYSDAHNLQKFDTDTLSTGAYLVEIENQNIKERSLLMVE